MAMQMVARRGGTGAIGWGSNERDIVAIRDLLWEFEMLDAALQAPVEEWRTLHQRARFLLTRVAMVAPLETWPEAVVLQTWVSEQPPFGVATPTRNTRVEIWNDAAPVGRQGRADFPRKADEGIVGDRHRWLVLSIVGLAATVLALFPLAGLMLSLRTFIVLSGSMAPALPTGSLIVSEPAATERLVVGEVITFPRPDRPGVMVTHRIVAVEQEAAGTFFRTRGDANGATDDWRVPAADPVWRYLFSVPRLGFALSAIAEPSGRFAMMVLPSLLLGALSLTGIWRDSRPVVTGV